MRIFATRTCGESYLADILDATRLEHALCGKPNGFRLKSEPNVSLGLGLHSLAATSCLVSREPVPCFNAQPCAHDPKKTTPKFTLC